MKEKIYKNVHLALMPKDKKTRKIVSSAEWDSVRNYIGRLIFLDSEEICKIEHIESATKLVKSKDGDYWEKCPVTESSNYYVVWTTSKPSSRIRHKRLMKPSDIKQFRLKLLSALDAMDVWGLLSEDVDSYT